MEVLQPNVDYDAKGIGVFLVSVSEPLNVQSLISNCVPVPVGDQTIIEWYKASNPVVTQIEYTFSRSVDNPIIILAVALPTIGKRHLSFDSGTVACIITGGRYDQYGRIEIDRSSRISLGLFSTAAVQIIGNFDAGQKVTFTTNGMIAGFALYSQISSRFPTITVAPSPAPTPTCQQYKCENITMLETVEDYQIEGRGISRSVVGPFIPEDFANNCNGDGETEAFMWYEADSIRGTTMKITFSSPVTNPVVFTAVALPLVSYRTFNLQLDEGEFYCVVTGINAVGDDLFRIGNWGRSIGLYSTSAYFLVGTFTETTLVVNGQVGGIAIGKPNL